MAMGTDNYPKSINETMNILNTFTKTNKNNYGEKKNYKTEATEVAFAEKKG